MLKKGEENMLRLRPYHPSDAQYVVGWLKDEIAFKKWSADRMGDYPLTADFLNAHYANAGVDFFVMTAVDDDGVVGQLSMRYPDEDRGHIRFGFIIVDDSRRGTGCGKAMLRLALRYAFDILAAEKVSLGVFENNPPAHRCYESIGFVETGGEWYCTILGEEWRCIEMEINKGSFCG